MAKSKTLYVCQQCGYSQTGWAGKCPECGAWSSLVETVAPGSSHNTKSSSSFAKKEVVKISDVKVRKTDRKKTEIAEMDRVLGGGFVEGQVVLIAGEPGIGKSTILLQIADNFGEVLYASGEESIYQISLRGKRLAVSSKTLSVLETTNVDEIIETANSKNIDLLIVDSVQTVATSDLSGMAGSVGQVRESTYRLVQFAKRTGTVVVIVGHVTKQGSVAGPAVLAHLVDTVLWFEGERDLTLRLLRSHKNRFGPTEEVGIFTMEEKGLISVTDPEALFLTSEGGAPGSAITSVLQGSRPMLVEIQALVVKSKLPYPKRVSQGIDTKRFEVILAVLERKVGIPLSYYDCYLNVAGGISIKDPSADFAVAVAIASSYSDGSLPAKSIFNGEIGLLGDIRPVLAQERRIKEAKRLGYKKVFTSSDFNYLSGAIKNILQKKK